MNDEEYKELMKQNRSTIFYFFKENDFILTYTEISGRKYKLFITPFKWDHSYLLINDMRVTDFQAVILFTNELVVRFSQFDDWQINIPYKSIKTISVSNDLGLGYHKLHLNKVDSVVE